VLLPLTLKIDEIITAIPTFFAVESKKQHFLLEYRSNLWHD
jgi:hypothetical protein